MQEVITPIEMRLLALVADREVSGREVAGLYQQKLGANLPYGTLYTTFRRLRAAGRVDMRENRERDGRVRYFSITPSGRRALAQGRDFYAKLSTFGQSPR